MGPGKVETVDFSLESCGEKITIIQVASFECVPGI